MAKYRILENIEMLLQVCISGDSALSSANAVFMAQISPPHINAGHKDFQPQPNPECEMRVLLEV